MPQQASTDRGAEKPNGMSRRRALICFAGLAGALSLAACGGGAVSTATAASVSVQQSTSASGGNVPATASSAVRTAGTVTTSAAASTTAVAASVSSVAKANGGIRFSFFGDNNEKAIWEKVGQQFSAASSITASSTAFRSTG